MLARRGGGVVISGRLPRLVSQRYDGGAVMSPACRGAGRKLANGIATTSLATSARGATENFELRC